MIVAPISSLRVGLKTILAGLPGIEIVAEAAALDELGGLPPHVEIVLVVVMENPAPSWFQSVLETHPQEIFLFLLNPSAAQPAFALPAKRALGILNINALPEEIGAAIGAVKAGFTVIDPQFVVAARSVPDSTVGQSPASGHLPPLFDDEQEWLIDPLTGREVEILQALAQGLTNKEIARQFAISEHTVKYHVTSIYSKLGVNNRTEAVRQGVHLGIITI